MTVVSPIDVEPMSPTVVEVDEVVGKDDGDTGDELVLDEDEEGGRAVGMGVAAAAEEEQCRRPDGAAEAARLGARRRCSK